LAATLVLVAYGLLFNLCANSFRLFFVGKCEMGQTEIAQGTSQWYLIDRQGVVNRALAELATRRLDDARRSLKTAAEVGADPLLLANLQNEVDYQQRLTAERQQ
jgi:hypothetical protein